MSFPTGPNEEERLKILLQTGALTAGPDPALEEICAQARQYFEVPTCFVSLLDRNVQQIRAAQGSNLTETSRDVAFCNYTILTDDVFVVTDARADERFRNNPRVTGEPRIRFYAGAPLVYLKDIRLGALCLLDVRPRTFSRGDKAELVVFAERAVAAIVARELERAQRV
jgi:GAF domain-containing protein